MTTRPPRASPRAGTYERTSTAGDAYWAFIPAPLPPTLDISGDLDASIAGAVHALGTLATIPIALGDSHTLGRTYARKEAVLSSQIEGTKATLADLLLREAGAVASTDDLDETLACVVAMDLGFRQVRSAKGLPVSTRLLREMHHALMQTVRGQTKSPGEIRRSQNWIGGRRPETAAFVPPPAERVTPLLSDLERYIHRRANPLVTAAVAHVQFETIHPFLDGNGRIGRHLLTLILCQEGLLSEPLLYLSLYLKQNRSTYYALLTRVREEGAWEEWLAFFCDAVTVTARGAVSTAQEIRSLIARDRATVLSAGSPRTLGVFDHLTRHAVLAGAPAVSRGLDMAPRTLYSAIQALEDLGIAAEVTGRGRDRVWVYRDYMDILNAGTDTPPG
jgi:Fic family protein